jgi:Tol biopolymer transport system component
MSAEPPRHHEPLGAMPHVTTTAVPEWIPFRVRAGRPVAMDPRERHLADLRQLTFGGDNAEAYFSPDSRKVIFQSTRDGAGCDQEFTMDLGSGETKRISSGRGRTTCGFYLYPQGDRVVYSTTEAASPVCPPKPDRSQGYVWPIESHDVYSALPDGSDLKPFITSQGYDAETTVSFDGTRVIFTSTRDGDLDLYIANIDGSHVRRITNTPGYDGGAFFSPDSSKIVWRASRPTGAALDEYKALLAKGLVKPTQLEIYTAGVEGQNARAITNNGKANFGPSFLPDSRRVVFSSNYDALPPSSGKAPNFDLYVVDPEAPPAQGGYPALERITYYDGFDGFPMFSPDGDYMVFASNRFGTTPGETNLFVARWVD